MIYLFLLIAATIPAIKTLFSSGFFASHDGEFHLVRLISFFSELNNGQFPVRLSSDLAYGYGYPVFNFFYPLVYYLASGVHAIGFNFGTSLKIIVGISLILSILFCYLWLRQHFNKLASFVGAFLYLYIPYRFTATYVSGAFGIVLAFTFAPLIFYSLYGLIKKNSNGYFLILSLSLALILVSHNVSAMIFIGLAVCYGFCLFVLNKNLKSLKKVLLAFVLAIGISSFFLIPMVHDLGYVNLKQTIAVDYNDHWPSLGQLIYSPWGYGYSQTGYQNDGMSFQLGIAQWMVIFLVVLVLSISLIRKNKLNIDTKLAIFFVVLFFVILFFTLKQSDFFWKILPLVKQIQFPWRLLMAQMIIFSFLGAWLVSVFSAKKFLQIFLVFFIIAIAFWGNRNNLRTFSSVRFSDEHYLSNIDNLNGSTDIAWEIRPKWVTFIPKNKPDSLIFESGEAKYIQNPNNKKERFNFSFETQKQTEIIANVFYYPNWKLKLFQNNILIQSELTYDKSTGLIKFLIPSGKTTAILLYQETLIQKVANLITLSSFLIWLFLLLKLIFYKIRQIRINKSQFRI